MLQRALVILSLVMKPCQQVIDEERLQENCERVGTHLLTQLASLRKEFSCVGDVRGKGLMVGLELVSDKETRSPLGNKHFADIWEDCKDMGLLVGRGGLMANVSSTLSLNTFKISQT